MSETKTIRFTPRLIVGALVILLGVVFTLDNLGVLEADSVLRFWPALLVLAGIYKVMQDDDRGRYWGFLWMGIGAWLLLFRLDYLSVDPVDFWPLVLVFVGVGLIRGAFRRSEGQESLDDNAEIHCFALMGGNERTSSSQAFVGGDFGAVMGGASVNLTGAQMAGDQAFVDVFAFWGGVEVVVPPEWRVESKVMPIMGAVEDTTKPPPSGEDAPTVVLRGFVLMGGVEITNPGAEG